MELVVGCAATPGEQAVTLLTLSREAKASNLCDLDMCLLQRGRSANQRIPMVSIFEARTFRRTGLQHVCSYLLTCQMSKPVLRSRCLPYHVAGLSLVSGRCFGCLHRSGIPSARSSTTAWFAGRTHLLSFGTSSSPLYTHCSRYWASWSRKVGDAEESELSTVIQECLQATTQGSCQLLMRSITSKRLFE